MILSAISGPRFRTGQSVGFAGGEGTIQNYKCEAGTWSYQVEMAMGLEPDFGRLGHETSIILIEAELEPLESDRLNYLNLGLAIA